MKVRELTPDDRADAVRLWSIVGLTRPWNPPGEDFDRALDAPSSAVLGLRDATGLVATVMVGHDGHRGWVYYLAVERSRLRSGLGRAMVEAAEQWLQDRGVVKLNVMVRRTNPEVLGFYERLGYSDADVVTVSRWLGGHGP